MKIFIIIVCIIAVISIPLLYFMFYGMNTVKKLVIRDINLSKISDGTYNGSYHKNRWTYDLEITVKDHKITSVKNTNKRMDTYKEFNEKLYTALIEKQKIPFDTVAGATINTKAFLKAAENSFSSDK